MAAFLQTRIQQTHNIINNNLEDTFVDYPRHRRLVRTVLYVRDGSFAGLQCTPHQHSVGPIGFDWKFTE